MVTSAQPRVIAGSTETAPISAFAAGVVAIAFTVLPGTGLIAVLPALIALVVGIWARKQVRDRVAEHEDLATLGFVFGIVTCLNWLLGMTALVA